jgi:hypothetical protein
MTTRTTWRPQARQQVRVTTPNALGTGDILQLNFLGSAVAVASAVALIITPA